MLVQSILTASLAVAASAASIQRPLRRSVQTGQPDGAPAGYEQYISPLSVPSKNTTGAGGWSDSLAKAKAFVAQLTVEELVNMTTGADVLQRCVGETGSVPRLGQRALCMEDSPMGVRFADYVSSFPAGINAAATFDRNLVYKRGYAMGAEHKGKGVDVALGPMMNLLRAPAAGRNWEGFAEVFLSGVFAAETTKGMQDAGVMACAKHFIGNEQEHFRGGSGGNASSSNIDDRTMHEMYLWPFAEAVRAGVASVMCSYQRVNQTHACENSKILNGLLKDEVDFQGFVMSDWGALVSGVSSALAGTDMNMPGFIGYGPTQGNQPNPAVANNSYWGAALVEAVNNGSVPIWRLQDMVTRIMTPYYHFNHQSSSYPNVSFSQLGQTTYVEGQGLVNLHVDVQSDHYKLIREIGGASTVLLKNVDNTLPLDASNVRRWGIFGSDAGPNYDGPNGCTDRGCDQGTLAAAWGSGTAQYPYLIDPLSAITHHVRSVRPTAVIEGVLNDTNYKAIQYVAPVAEVCLTFVNADSGEGYITVEGNAGDRNDLKLWHQGDALIQNVTETCNNTIVVVHGVGAVDMESFADNPNVTAILWAGLPGQSGNAITDVLFGGVNPSGRLPFTIGKNRTDYPADVLYETNQPIIDGVTIPQITYSEGLELDYRHFDAKNITPRYEFGYGLSYTKFEYDSLSVSSANEKRDLNQLWNDGVDMNIKAPGGNTYLYDHLYDVSVGVKNVGNRDGYEVVQMYLGFPESAGEPPKILRGFERVWVEKGGCATVTMPLNRKELSIWDVEKQRWVMPKGEFKIYIGKSSRDIQLEGTLNVY